MTRESELDDMKVHVRLKLSLLWAALMFFYIYGDYFGLYVPGQLKGMLEGQGPIGPVSEGSLAIVSILTVLPGLMVFLSIVLPPRVNRMVELRNGPVLHPHGPCDPNTIPQLAVLSPLQPDRNDADSVGCVVRMEMASPGRVVRWSPANPFSE